MNRNMYCLTWVARWPERDNSSRATGKKTKQVTKHLNQSWILFIKCNIRNVWDRARIDMSPLARGLRNSFVFYSSWSMGSTGSQRVRHDYVTELNWFFLVSELRLCPRPPCSLTFSVFFDLGSFPLLVVKQMKGVTLTSAPHFNWKQSKTQHLANLPRLSEISPNCVKGL